MRRRWIACVGLVLLTAAGVPQDRSEPGFVALDVFVDAGAAQLAAWQLEVVGRTGKLVGVEGGAPAAFVDAPRYDPAALQGGRVILAALAQGDDLPTGRVRVARIHLMEPAGMPGDYTVRGVVAASPDGQRIEVEAELTPLGDKR